MNFLKIITLSSFILIQAFASPQAAADEGSSLSDPFFLGKIIITASRMAQHDYKVAGNVSVITRDQIEASNAQNIADILKETLGVHVSDNSTAKSAVIDIRGFGDTAARNVLVLINDRKINAADISGPDLIQIPIGAVERIEIIRGAGTVLYGDNAAGGVVNIITKKGQGDLSGKIGGIYGSYDTHGKDLEISGEYKDMSYFLYAKYLDEGGYRDNSGLIAKDFNARLGYKLSQHLAFDLNFGWHKDDQRLPGGLSDAELVSLGRTASADANDFSTTKDRYVNLGFDVSPWPEDIAFGHFVVNLHFRERDVFDSFNSFGPFNTDRSIDTKGFNIKYIFDRPVFGKEMNFVTGIDFTDNENTILGSGDNVDDITITKEEFGIYGYLQYELLEDLFINGGTRYYEANYAFSQRNVAVDEKQRPDEWASMGGLKYEYGPGSNVHFNIQQTFRFLATDEWYSTANFPGFGITPGLNLDLKQQTGIQYETGVKHNFKNIVTANITLYQMDITDEIFLDPVTSANSNYDKTRRIGTEVGTTTNVLKLIGLDFLDKLDFFTNYVYQNAEFRDGINDGKDIPMVPRHQANGGVITKFLKHYHASLIGRYVGSRFVINDTANETAPLKPYFILDGKLAYQNGHIKIFMSVNNILNERYSTTVTKSTFSATRAYFPAPEKNYTFGIDVIF